MPQRYITESQVAETYRVSVRTVGNLIPAGTHRLSHRTSPDPA
jgi:hypothetical protein